MKVNGNAKGANPVKSKGISREKLLEIQNFTLEMLAKNKINIKNSWDLDIIDHMGELIHNPNNSEKQANDENVPVKFQNLPKIPDEVPLGNEDDLNFQKASCTLDASVKIYSYRVDSVHNQTYKVLGGLNRSAFVDLNENDGNDDIDNPEMPISEGVEKKKSVHQKKSTLATSAAQINSKDLDEENWNASMDPSLFLVGDGLWLSRLEVHDGCRVMLTFESSKEDFKESDDQLVDVSPILCEDLLDGRFNFMKLNPALDSFRQLLDNLKKIEMLDDSFRENNDQKPDLDISIAECGLNKGSFEEYEDDFDLNDGEFDIFESQNYLNPSENVQSNESVFPGSNSTPEENGMEARSKNPLNVLLSNDSNDYAFFKPENLKRLTSLTHWKFGKSLKSQKVNEGNSDKKTKKTSRKKKTSKKDLIDFYADPPAEKDWLPPKSLMKNKITRAKKIELEENADQLLLSEYADYNPEQLMNLFLKPNLTISFTTNGSSQEFCLPSLNSEPKACTNYDGHEDNFDDHDNFEDDDFDDNNYATQNDEFAYSAEHKEVAGELELIDRPRIAQKIEINFAKTAKKVDVKALKSNIWNAIQIDSGHEETIEPLADSPEEQPEVSTTFQSVVNNV
jgi:condensin complex subunit 2